LMKGVFNYENNPHNKSHLEEYTRSMLRNKYIIITYSRNI